MAKSIAIYSRKSKFTGKGDSIENQIELCRQFIEKQYAEENTLEILIYEDEGFSGKNTSRPQFEKLLQAARDKRFSVLVCYRLDRVSRNVGDFALLMEELHQYGIEFVSIRESFDTSNPMGRAMMYIASVFAQLERETIAERIRDNMYELSKTGRWLGGTTPTGYSSESIEKLTIDGKLHKSCRLKLIPEEAQLVSLIFDKYLETGSLTKTEAFLVQNHYTTKNKLSFTRFSIRSILSNPVYMIADQEAYRYIVSKKMELFSEEREFNGKHGIMAYNRTLQRDGLAHKNRSMEEWIIAVGKHEGVVNGKRWVKTQELLALNSSKAYRKPRSNVALLSGLLVCGSCGSYMRPKLTRRYGEDGDRIYEYLCSMKERSKGACCNIKNARGNALDKAVVEQVTVLQKDDSMFIEKLEELDQTLQKQQLARNSEKERLKRLWKEIDKDLSSLVSTLARASGTAAEPYILKQIADYHERLEQVNSRIVASERNERENELSEEERSGLSSSMMSLGFVFDQAAIEQRRAALRLIVKKAVWDGQILRLYL